jgi:hypothetical protein
MHSLISALDGGERSASRPGHFTPRERATGTQWTGGWVGPRAVLDAVVKRKVPSPLQELNPRTLIVQPVAQRYTDWAITAQQQYSGKFNSHCTVMLSIYEVVYLPITGQWDRMPRCRGKQSFVFGRSQFRNSVWPPGHTDWSLSRCS